MHVFSRKIDKDGTPKRGKYLGRTDAEIHDSQPEHHGDVVKARPVDPKKLPDTGRLSPR